MTLRPYSNTVQETFRSVMGTPAAPETFDDETPVQPVALVGGSITATASPTQRTIQIVAGSVASNNTVTVKTGTGAGHRITAFHLNILATAAGTITVQVGGTTILACSVPIGSTTTDNWVYPQGNEPTLALGATVTIQSSALNCEGRLSIEFADI